MTIPSFSLAGKVALVTGARRGISRAVSLTFAEAGADIVVCDKVIEDGELEASANEIRKLGRRSLAVQVDTSRKSDVENMVQKAVDEFGGIDILFNGAAVVVRRPLFEIEEEEWDKVIDIDLKGVFLCSQAVAKRMINRKQGGNIISMASRQGVMPGRNIGAYPIAKAGVIMLTRTLALELASSKIRVNAIAPGPVKTKFNESIWSDPERYKAVAAKVPLGQWLEPSDILGTALFLASEASGFITGHTILVDGGIEAGR